jgi:hypothetical protein
MDKVTEINCLSGEIIERPLTNEEKALLASDQEVVQTEISEQQDVVALLVAKVEELEKKLQDLA